MNNKKRRRSNLSLKAKVNLGIIFLTFLFLSIIIIPVIWYPLIIPNAWLLVVACCWLIFISIVLMLLNFLIFNPFKILLDKTKGIQTIQDLAPDKRYINHEWMVLDHKLDYLIKKFYEHQTCERQNQSKYSEYNVSAVADSPQRSLPIISQQFSTDKKINTKESSYYDQLTALPNRIFFNEVLNKSLKLARRHNHLLAILFIDIDHFQKINEDHGKACGDHLIHELSSRLANIIRAGDTIARFDSDEYMILLSDIANSNLIGPIAEKLLHACSQPFKWNQQAINITASIGIAVFPDDGNSLESLQQHADIAMYKAKHNGGNCYQFYRQEMFIAAHEHVVFESALRKAIKHHQFVLHYQPQLCLKSGVIKSVEALIRWQHPELGLLNPDRFIPFAENSGLIMAIGEWALYEACCANKKWQTHGFHAISIAVNISPKQLQQQNIVVLIKQILNKSHLEAKFLEIEITETAIMDNVELTIDQLKEIHTMGVNISIDDFGTGYTSFNYLKQFPLSRLKIDKSFIKEMPSNQNDAAITAAIIALAHSLSLLVVAEGVETLEQIQYLAEHHCDLIQGYFVSRPLPANKILMQLSQIH